VPDFVPTGRQVRLARGEQELVVVEAGGGIRSYTAGGRGVIDGYSEGEMSSGGRGQILAPWPNRLADGRFDWGGRSWQEPLSEPEHGNAIHGLVRWAPWRVTEEAGDRARLEYRLHSRSGWPWALDLAVTYVLHDRGMEVQVSATYLGAPEGVGDAGESCPFGLGWHPYVAAFGGLVDDTVLRLPASTAYRSDDRGLPVERYAVDGTGVDFRPGRRIGADRLDTAFTDLARDDSGRAVVELTSAEGGGPGVSMWMDAAYTHVMVFSGDTLADPARRRGGLAIEPMTCAPNALRSGDGLVTLEHGQTIAAAWGIEPFKFS
jgi:aldose 1-epimerase